MQLSYTIFPYDVNECKIWIYNIFKRIANIPVVYTFSIVKEHNNALQDSGSNF